MQKKNFKYLNWMVGNQYQENEEEMSNFIKYIGGNKSKIITYCHKCKMEFPFNIKKIYKDFIKEVDSNYYIQITKYPKGKGMLLIPGKINVNSGSIAGMQPPYEIEDLLNNEIWYIEYNLNCTNDYSHKYIMLISVEIKDGKFIVRKIGQNSSMITVKGFDFDKYKKILDKLNAYEDYKKADLSNAEQFYVGAYAYLRRIFEKMIYYYLGDKEIEDDHMDKKIEAVKEEFDPRVRKLLKNLYGILSISIH